MKEVFAFVFLALLAPVAIGCRLVFAVVGILMTAIIVTAFFVCAAVLTFVDLCVDLFKGVRK